MSKKKQGGKTAQHVRPAGKRLGVKLFAGQNAAAGAVIVRQRGTKISAGKGVKVGRDHTIYAAVAGIVKFGKKLDKKIVSVVSN
jgi:large subunit ribosomal protein L27